MALKIKTELYAELCKLKRQKKGISSYLVKKGYSASWIANVSKNWKTLEVVGGPVNVSTKAKSAKVAKPKAKKVAIVSVADTVESIPQKELVLNISEGLEVKAEVLVKQLSHPRTIMATIVNILSKKSGAKVTSNAGLDLDNAPETLDGFTLAINETH